jgi:cytidylate kinase
MIIAIDGPAGAGKGTLAKRIAAHYGLHHLDTGLLYRAVGRDVLAAGRDPADAGAATAAARSLDPATLDDPELRSEKIGAVASVVAAVPAVRAALLDFQRNFARRAPGAVLDGRDIGTVVCPEAEVKMFVTAAVEVRAERRWREMTALGEPKPLARVLEELKVRDERDSRRGTAPLVLVPEAIVIDTSKLDPDAVFAAAVKAIGTRVKSG